MNPSEIGNMSGDEGMVIESDADVNVNAIVTLSATMCLREILSWTSILIGNPRLVFDYHCLGHELR
jgi:hypothetical protein